MNIYKHHSDPKSLKHYDAAHEAVPKLVWEKYKNNPSELKKRENALAKDPVYAYLYATDVLHGPFPKGEDTIAKSSVCAYLYVKNVIKGRWPPGEPAIAKSNGFSFEYGKFLGDPDWKKHLTPRGNK
jgi:hypothetical protein